MIKKSIIIIINEVFLFIFKTPVYHPRFWEDEKEKRRYVHSYGIFKKLRVMLSGFNSDKYELNKIRNEARRLNLSGFIKKQNFEEIEIVLSGEEEGIGLFAEFLENGNHGIKSFEMRKYHKPIVMGFYIDS